MENKVKKEDEMIREEEETMKITKDEGKARDDVAMRGRR